MFPSFPSFSKGGVGVFIKKFFEGGIKFSFPSFSKGGVGVVCQKTVPTSFIF